MEMFYITRKASQAHKMNTRRFAVEFLVDVPVDFSRLSCISPVVAPTHCAVDEMSNKGATKKCEGACRSMCKKHTHWETFSSVDVLP